MLKRKPPQTAAARKRAKTFDARTLAAQSSDAALSASGELDVAAYVSAREFEVRALEKGMQQSRGALTSRAFQQVPRALRRRTASHNVKRVPRRLRARAKREMIEDNTPTVTARRRKPTQHLRIRLETARRLQNLNAKTKARRQQSKSKQQDNLSEEDKVHTHPYSTAPRIPKIKKNQLSRPPPPEAKYRKRQRTKTWLPTHVFHAKRAHMTPAAQPLWRFAVPLSPTEKSYRPSHRARGARGAVAWDMSYMATILIEGAEEGLEGVLRGVGVDGEEAWGRKGRRWREGTRALQTWVFEQGQRSGAGEGEDGRTRGRPIAPVTLIRAAKEKKGPNEVEMVDADDSSRSKTKKNQGDRRKIFIRVHPSAFIQLWRDLLGLAKRQKPPVMVEDLRFDIGSIEVAGPGSTEALIAALQPYSSTGYKTPAVAASDPDSPEATWTSLLGVTNPSSLPQNALLAFPISDPRLRFPCQTLRPRSDEAHMQDQARLLASWPPDHTQGPAQLFDRPSRLAASRQLPSQKAINRRRTLAGLGSYPDPQPGDPQIPMIIFASRPSATVGSTLDGHSKSNSNSNLPGSWTVLLPWKCVLPVWYTVMYYPLSSGGNPRFGGLQEQQQLAFEAGTPWFPGDFPGTRAGWEWGLRERERIRQEWERRPKGRRVEFDRLDLGHDKHNEDNGKKERGEFGRGWACDWERLLQLPRDEEGNEGRVENEGERLEPGQQKQPAEPNAHPGPRPVENDLPQQIYQLRPEDAEAALAGYHPGSHSQNSSSIDRGALATVRISLVGRGTPTPRARIYRLPDEGALRQQWLRQATDRNKNNDDNSDQTIMTSEAVRWSGIESGPTEENRLAAAAAAVAPPLPDEDDVIGFVTTGGFNLAEGQGTGIGSIALSKVMPSKPKRGGRRAEPCIVRGAGERVGRLGRWTLV